MRPPQTNFSLAFHNTPLPPPVQAAGGGAGRHGGGLPGGGGAVPRPGAGGVRRAGRRGGAGGLPGGALHVRRTARGGAATIMICGGGPQGAIGRIIWRRNDVLLRGGQAGVDYVDIPMKETSGDRRLPVFDRDRFAA